MSGNSAAPPGRGRQRKRKGAGRMKKWWSELEPAWKAATALGAAIGLGMFMGGWVGIPAQVRANTLAISDNAACCESALHNCADTQQKLDRMLCNQDPDMSYEQCELRYGRAVFDNGDNGGGGGGEGSLD